LIQVALCHRFCRVLVCKGGVGSSVLKPATSRKRALSHSPLEYSFDIESLTRSSEGSLHLRSLSAGHSSPGLARSSGGSYGHLSAGQCRRIHYHKIMFTCTVCFSVPGWLLISYHSVPVKPSFF